MRQLLLIIFIISCGSSYKLSNNGWSYYEEVEKLYKKGQLNLAILELNKAEKGNYGFCGNAYASGIGRAKVFKAKIYNEQKLYIMAIKELDSMSGCIFGANCYQRDSLKIVVYRNWLGKEILDSIINSQKNTVYNTDSLNDTNQAIEFVISTHTVERKLRIFVKTPIISTDNQITYEDILEINSLDF